MVFKVKSVFVVFFGEFGGYVVVCKVFKWGFKDNLSGFIFEVKNSCGGGVVWFVDFVEEVVGCDLGIYFFVGVVYDCDVVFFVGDEGEGVFCFDFVVDCFEDFVWFFFFD